MILVIHELVTTLTQNLTADKNTILDAVRPHLYRHGHPAGSLQIQVYDASDVLLSTSNSVAISDIGTANYFHGYVRFDVNAGLKRNQVYKFRLVATGYSFSESGYIAWSNDYDLKKYSYVSPEDAIHAPLDIELYERTTR
jgi:hypothetical protein